MIHEVKQSCHIPLLDPPQVQHRVVVGGLPESWFSPTPLISTPSPDHIPECWAASSQDHPVGLEGFSSTYQGDVIEVLVVPEVLVCPDNVILEVIPLQTKLVLLPHPQATRSGLYKSEINHKIYLYILTLPKPFNTLAR